MKRMMLFGLISLFLIPTRNILAQVSSQPVLEQTFENDTSGWTAGGASASVSRTNDLAYVKEGKSALQFNYVLQKGEMDVLILPLTEGSLTNVKSFQFWMRANASDPLVMVLQENGGGRYVCPFMTRMDRWQRVNVSIKDFVLSENKDDPKDPDGKLDMDQVVAVGFLDFDTMLAQQGAEAIGNLFSFKPGDHKLYMDDFIASPDILPEYSGVKGSVYQIDNFKRPQPMWIIMGDAQSSIVPGENNSSNMQLEYRQSTGHVLGMIRVLGNKKLANATAIQMEASSLNPAKLLIQLELDDGSKFNATTDLVGDGKMHPLNISHDDFTLADDTKGTRTQLDMAHVSKVMIIEATGLTDTVDQDNTLVLSNIRAVLPQQ